MSATAAQSMDIQANVPAAASAKAEPKRLLPTTSIISTRPYDVALLLPVIALLGIGSVMVYSASIGVADMRFADPSRYLRSHLRHVFVGLAALAVGMTLNYQVWKRYCYWVLGLAMLLLMATVLGLGINRGHSTRWIGPSFFEFQPAELAKLAFVIYLAYSLEKKLQHMHRFAIAWLPHLIVAGVMILFCLMQPDLGTSLVLGVVLCAMLWVAGSSSSYVLGAFFVAVPLAAQWIAMSSNRVARILVWINPWDDRYGAGFQTVNALTSLASGGLTGMGLGAGRQKMGFLTQGWTDFIFSSIGEELGLLGCGIVAGMFGMIVWRGFRASWRAPDKFGRYLAFGITLLIGFQAVFNMGVAVGLLPTKGLNLPFVSGGGSSLLISCFAVGILLNVSRYSDSSDAWRPLVWQRKEAKSRRPVRQKRELKKGAAKKEPRRPVTQKTSGVAPFHSPSKGGRS